MRVSVVLLSYARPEKLERALDSVMTQTLTELEVLVVDNKSGRSEDVARVVARAPGARLVASPTNLGYAAGMNLGVREARGERVHLTEDDMILAPDCLERLVEHLDANPGVAVASGLVRRLGEDRIHCAGGRLTLGSRFRLEMLGVGGPASGWRGEPYPVDYATGAMLCARRDLLLRLGPFRAEFFLFMEDVELCLRLRRAGLRLDVVPAARAEHCAPDPGPPRPELQFHNLKNALATFALHAPATRLAPLLLRTGAISPVLRALRERDPGPLRVAGRSLSWFLPRLPSYLRERGASQSRIA